MDNKQSRADTIVSAIMKLAAEHGTVFPHHKCPGTLLRLEHWEVKILPQHRWSMARSYREETDRRLFEAPGWRTIELCWRGARMFVVNLRGDRVDVHYFRPGAWEERFGSVPGNDTVLHQPWNDPIGPSAEDQLRMREQDLKLPSKREGPPSGDELRNPTMRQCRSRAKAGKTDGPYTVALSQRKVPDF